MSILLRRCTTQFLPLAPREFDEVDPELGVVLEMEALGVFTGVLSLPRLLGVLELDLLPDWGVLRLPVLPGVL